MVKQQIEIGQVSYTLGILSIVFAFISPLGGIILGIVGLIQSRKPTSPILKKARILNTIGIILGIVIVLVGLIFISKFGALSTFPSI